MAHLQTLLNLMKNCCFTRLCMSHFNFGIVHWIHSTFTNPIQLSCEKWRKQYKPHSVMQCQCLYNQKIIIIQIVPLCTISLCLALRYEGKKNEKKFCEIRCRVFCLYCIIVLGVVGWIYCYKVKLIKKWKRRWSLLLAKQQEHGKKTH